jgi:hypothetical protein
MAQKTAPAVSSAASKKPHRSHATDRDYDLLLSQIHARFALATEDPKTKLFTTDATGLFNAFLAGLPAGRTRQLYTCHACRQFFDRFGGLVTIDERGTAESALWGFIPPKTFDKSIATMQKIVRKSKVTGAFLTSKGPWGTPVTGEWSHIHVVPRGHLLSHSAKLTPGQRMAEKLEEYAMLRRGLADFPRAIIEQAVGLLNTDALYRSEKCLGVARWFLNLHNAMDAVKGTMRDNIAWRAVAAAPPGWCHVRSSMIGTLLEDLAAGMEFSAVASRFAAKMHPLSYQRPTAPPSAGNIEAAEKLFEKLGLAKSLERRFATLDDLVTVWTPRALEQREKTGGLFGHLKDAGKVDGPDLHVPAQRITFAKFRETVLPNAERITYSVPPIGSYVAMTTAVHADAPPILQWDREEKRNPVAWYMYHNGSPSSQWGLTYMQTVEVTAIALTPPQWDESRPMGHQGKGAFFILKGAVDSQKGHGGLFPESLRSELHEVRSTIEAHQHAAELQGRESASACGIDSRSGRESFSVKLAGMNTVVTYLIDRWD